MSHNSDPKLSQVLQVDTGEQSIDLVDNSKFYDDNNSNRGNNDNDDTNSLGPLPPKWEKAYTENGEVYFIDHSTGTSHWLDPRLSKFQKKSLEDCLDDELPYGWEKISDPNYGTYFIDHVNRRTQYENPVIQAKRAALQANSRNSRTSFTKDPSELCGQRFRTSLVKSSRGLGFTIVGGDDGVDEFLQIKSVVPKGPAWLDGQLQTGDVIVYVNDVCVLGYTHNQIVRLFQSINVGSTVSLEVCRGYPLPFDPNDPNTEVVTTIAVDSQQITPDDKRLLDTNYNFLDNDDTTANRDDITEQQCDEFDDIIKGIGNLGKVQVRVNIVKGNLGFGFTIADSACGQRVKQILDRQRCKNLIEGDILLEINDISLKNMSHDQVVQVLKNCPYNSEATICVQRGCVNKTPNIRNKLRKLDNRYGNRDINNIYRSKTPTADIYSTQPREILPSRPKTPLVDTRNLTKTPIKDLNSNLNNDMYKCEYVNDNYNNDHSRLRLSLIDNPDDIDDDIDLSENNQNKSTYDYTSPTNIDPKYSWSLRMLHQYDCNCYTCRTGLPETPENYATTVKKDLDYWPQRNCEYITTSVILNRQENGFGFRIVGGIEDKSQVAVGHIVAGGAADLDGRIRSGDEIVSVDGFSVLKASHRQVVRLMNAAGARGQVNLVVRRRVYHLSQQKTSNQYQPIVNWSHENHQQLQQQQQQQIQPPPPPPLQQPPQPANLRSNLSLIAQSTQLPEPHYDVTVQRNENEGFGFVIISSANKQGSTIGRLIEDSPAERCGRLHVGDYIIAVNHIAIMNLNHGDIVNLIKESGLSVTLTIAPNYDP